MRLLTCVTIVFLLIAAASGVYRVCTLTHELDTVKSQLAAEITQRERLEKLRIDMDKSAESRRKDSENFRKELEGVKDEETAEILSRAVPDSVLRGLRSVKNDRGANAEGSR